MDENGPCIDELPKMLRCPMVFPTFLTPSGHGEGGGELSHEPGVRRTAPWPAICTRLRFQVLEIKLRFFGIYCGFWGFIVVYCGLLFQDVSMLQGRFFWKVLKKTRPTSRELSMSDMRDRWWANIGQQICFETSKQCKTNISWGNVGI